MKDEHMPIRIRDKESHHLKRVTTLAEERLPKKDRPVVLRFIEAYFANVATDDLLARTPEQLYGAALSHWKFAANRMPGNALVRVYNPTLDLHGWRSPHTIIEIVNDDMPFLVDSVLAALNGMGREVFLLVHPILDIARTKEGEAQGLAEPGKGPRKSFLRESFMHIEIDEQTQKVAREAIETKIKSVLADVRAAVGDWKATCGKLEETIEELSAHPPAIAREDVAETLAFLRWLLDNHFTFLGFRDYRFEGKPGEEVMQAVPDSALGILKDPSLHVLKSKKGQGVISPEVRHFLRSSTPLIVTKANMTSTVHRPVRMDYIGVKLFDADGKVVGERRFVGLFTSVFYTLSPAEIPLLRRKVARTLEALGFHPASHDGKALLHILDTFPRDELFHIDPDQLIETAVGILRLEERPRVKVFLREDKFERFVSALVYAPRDIYSSELRNRIESVLIEAYDGETLAHYTQIGDDPLARVHMIIRTRPGKVPLVDPEEIDRRIVEIARRWEDRLREALVSRLGEEEGIRLWAVYGDSFSAAYREVFDPESAVDDIEVFERLPKDRCFRFHVYRLLEDDPDWLRIKFYNGARLVPLSDCLPMLEHAGFKVIEEQAYDLDYDEDRHGWILDFLCRDPDGRPFDMERVKTRLEEALWATHAGLVENDGFNALVVKADLTWREANIFRGICKYLRQTEITYSQDYMQAALARQPDIVASMRDLFFAFFALHFEGKRTEEAKRLKEQIEKALENVASLDQDRIIRLYVNVIESILRTNYFQKTPEGNDPAVFAFKIDSHAVEALPEPRPLYEIFVYAPRFEGIHLRGGKVARGGIRWSDRPEDFRTEVLGLMKAQMVKNSLIVPVGAKGGFVPKRLPASGTREEVTAEAVAAYKLFIDALLDLTDNIENGKTVPPRQMIRRDGDDPYLVVAADKGTASFSDIANEISKAHGFWLGDAFASGGSVGYDHKKMGITARGAWVAVQRHFREMGVDVQKTPIRVVGIGDMSGDVFGNGMMRSRALKLVAAFDHRDIFIDPRPDEKTAFTERERLFNLPRSSWQDYDTTLISKGGGVFSRQLKSIPLTPEIKKLTGLSAPHVTPAELIHALLLVEADLLWVGGIGTFVKASYESQAQVGDRANDTVRVNARDLKFKVVGEGGNLGFTQLGRIEYAKKGGRIDTDAVDNAAGVNTSDHEVNIKILLNHLVASGDMTEKQRVTLLSEMTDEVAEAVLEDNYQQTQGISVTQLQGGKLIEYQRRLMRVLEKRGRLKREIEYLPSDEEMAELAAEEKGLTRPEIAVLMAYAKLTLYDDILESDISADPALAGKLAAYMPATLDKACGRYLDQHALKREIVATELANEIINYVGPGFMLRVQEESGFGLLDAIRAYVIAHEIYDMRALWSRIEALDNKVPATIQYLMMIETVELLRRNSQWILTNGRGKIEIGATITRYEKGVASLLRRPADLLVEFELHAFEEKRQMYVEHGVPEDLAATVASLEAMSAACDIVEVAEQDELPVEVVGSCYFRLGSLIGLDWLRNAAEECPVEDHWDRLAVNAMIDDIFRQQRALTLAALRLAKGRKPQEAAAEWARAHKEAVERTHQLMADFRSSGPMTVSKLGYAIRFVRQLVPR